MTSPTWLRWTVALPVLGYAVAAVITTIDLVGSVPVVSTADGLLTILAPLPCLALGNLVASRRPRSPAGPALLLLAAAPTVTSVIEYWGASAASVDPWWGSDVGLLVSPGAWVFNLTGFVLLALTFPDGRLPGRRWTAMPWLFLLAAVAVAAAVSQEPAAADGDEPGTGPGPLWMILLAAAFVLLLSVLVTTVSSLVVRYRRGHGLTRLQLRWLLVGAGSVPTLLAAGWVAEALGASVAVAYTGFMVALLVVLPATVAIAILRHDLLDLDRLLSSSASWALTSVISAAVFALVVVGVAELGTVSVGDASRVTATAAAFVTALLLLPLHRRVVQLVGRALDRERTVSLARMREFVRRVRDGQAEPEAVEGVLRECLQDRDLAVLLVSPGSTAYVDLVGRPREPAPDAELIQLDAMGSPVAVIILGVSSARRVRHAREIAVEARLPIEVSRLRLQLRQALDDARASRSRLVEAGAVERKRLERDLHDGAQQRILAVGMRLRSVQRRHEPDDPTYGELEIAVSALEATVGELRRLAHGIRPSGLDDGLETAIRALVSASPIPVDICVGDVEMTEVVATTAYFVVAEGLANTLKHAGATSARVSVTRCLDKLAVEVSDDGRGGARAGFGLTALRDRVAALGGHVEVVSPAGLGTTIRAEL